MQMLLLLVILLVILFLVPFRGEPGGLGRRLFVDRNIWTVFWALIGVFGLNLLGFVPKVNEFFDGPIYALLVLAFIVLGVALVILTRKSNIQGRLRAALLLTGASPTGVVVVFIIGSILDGITNWAGDVGNFLIYILFALFVVSATASVMFKINAK
ncbi:MAG: hypothetical protein ACRKGH_09545 [Dehalogenimonas sp.]